MSIKKQPHLEFQQFKTIMTYSALRDENIFKQYSLLSAVNYRDKNYQELALSVKMNITQRVFPCKT